MDEGRADKGVPEESLGLQLDEFRDIGDFTRQEIGLHVGKGTFILPILELVQRKKQLAGQGNPLGLYRDTVVFEVVKGKYLPAFVSVPMSVFQQEGFKDGEMATLDGFEDFNWKLVEQSFAVDGWSTLLADQQMVMSFYIAEQLIHKVTGKHVWEFDGLSQGNMVGSFVTAHDNLAKLLNMPAEVTEEVLGNSILAMGRIVGLMLDGNIEKARLQMAEAPELLNMFGDYLTAMLASGQARDIFTPEQIETMVITFCKAETAILNVDAVNRRFPEIQSRYSTIMNMLMDLMLVEQAPDAFAYGNKALLEDLDLMSYLTRVRVTRANVDLGGLDLPALQSVLEQENGAQTDVYVTITHKSVFTALGEVMDSYKEDFRKLLKQRGLEWPDLNMPQLLIDVALVKLLQTVLEHPAAEEMKLLEAMYQKLIKTTDIVRGSVFMKDESYDDVINEAIGKGMQVVGIFDFHDESGSNPFVFMASDGEKRADLAKDLRLPIDAHWSVLVRGWFAKHREEYPYAGLHIYDDVKIYPQLVRRPSGFKQVDGEVRLFLNDDDIRMAIHSSREVFKWLVRSSHLTVEKEGGD